MCREPIRSTESSSDVDISMDNRRRLDQKAYIERLRRMTVEQKLQMMFELTERGKTALREALRKEVPRATEEELHRIFLERWHNTDD
jgi:hypothetical protein